VPVHRYPEKTGNIVAYIRKPVIVKPENQPIREVPMIVGILKEIKAEDNRVCMTPSGVEVRLGSKGLYFGHESGKISLP
jgi:hypothetical protein